MRIEEVEAYEFHLNDPHYTGTHELLRDALAALRAEAWHPIEKAEELGAKDGRWVILWDGKIAEPSRWGPTYFSSDYDWRIDSHRSDCTYGDIDIEKVTHFRFINPPEGA